MNRKFLLTACIGVAAALGVTGMLAAPGLQGVSGSGLAAAPGASASPQAPVTKAPSPAPAPPAGGATPAPPAIADPAVPPASPVVVDTSSIAQPATPVALVPPVVVPPVVVPPVVVPPVVVPPVVVPPVLAGPRTVVSLTFDDGNADQLAAASILDAAGIHGTFFVISGYIGAAGYLSRADLDRLAAAGHEIGGHTVTHADLTTLPIDEVRRQICNDRVALSSWGFNVRSFAYPFAATSDAVEAVAAECGYASARMLGDIASRFGCADCGAAESLPPADPWYTRALDQVDSTWTLDDLTGAVIRAEAVGGWVQFTFHNVCTASCGSLSITPDLLAQFAGWLHTRGTTHNTVTSTVGDAVGTPGGPVIPGPVAQPGGGVQNPGLETPGTGAAPQCWFQAPYGENVAEFSTVSPGHTGATASRIVMSGYVSGDAKILPSFDLGSCAPGAVAGATYELGSWYTSTTVTQFAVYLRTSSGAWEYWTSSPWFAASADWTQALWTTPAIPAGYTGISFGLNIFSNGELVTDDYSIRDVTAAPAVAPTEPIAPVAPVAPAAPAAEVADPATVPDEEPTGEATVAPESDAPPVPPGETPAPVAAPQIVVDPVTVEPGEAVTTPPTTPAAAP